MLINEYFHIIESQISDCINVVETRVTKDQRSLHIGIIEGELLFKDGSALYFVEFANVKVGVEIYKYSYQYQDRNSNLIFRYDMAPHHREISSFPHHKHIDPINVISSAQPSLLQVLDEIENIIINL